MRTAALIPLAILAAAGCSTPHADAFPPGGRWVDLSHDFAADTIYWPTAAPFVLEKVADGDMPGGFYYAANAFRAAEHGGTHVDAPVHFARRGTTVDRIPLDRLIGPGVVVDVTSHAARDRDYEVTTADLLAWEDEHGTIPEGAIVLLRTGFAAFWPDAGRYLGTAHRGEAAVAELSFPGLHPDAAQWLVTRRSISAVGIDTASIDHGRSTAFHSHRILFAKGVPALENVAGLEALPATGARVFALPMKIRGGSGGPARIIAWIPAMGPQPREWLRGARVRPVRVDADAAGSGPASRNNIAGGPFWRRCAASAPWAAAAGSDGD